jgi:hypothetical protein
MSDDDIGTVRWFGESWGAPVNDPRAKIDTPLGTRCLECMLWIKNGDQGFRIDGGENPGFSYFHKKCFLAAIGAPDAD